MADMLERRFTGPEGAVITARIRFPVQDPALSDEWSCSYQIVGLGSGKWRQAFGADGVQALLLALSSIASTLYVSEAYLKGELVWLDSPLGDLGLAKPGVIEDFLQDKG